MAINTNLIRRPNDRSLYLGAAILFPLLVLIGYFRTYYFSAFFDVQPLANALVHLHGIVMTAWVIFFVVQTMLIRSKNVKLHTTLGLAGIALAAIVVVVGLLTAYDAQLVRRSAPPGSDPHVFFILPVGDMFLFVVFFAAAIYYRKRPFEHKSLMLLTAINFLPAALFRIPLVPAEYATWFAFGTASLIAVSCLIWFTVKHGKLNKIYAAATLLVIVGLPLRMVFAETWLWHGFVRLLAP